MLKTNFILTFYFILSGTHSYDKRNLEVDQNFLKFVRSKYSILPFPRPPDLPENIPENDRRVHNELAVKFLEKFDVAYGRVLHLGSLLDWDYNVNITVENGDRLADFDLFRVTYLTPWRLQAAAFLPDRLPQSLARQLRMIQRAANSVEPDISRNIGAVHHSLQSLYNAGKICYGSNGTRLTYCLKGEPDMARLMARSREPEVLLWAWKAWRDAVGPPMRESYFRFVDLQNQLARSGGGSWTDMGEVWQSAFGLDPARFRTLCEDLYRDIRPLYGELHAFVRRRLVQFYGDDVMFGDGDDSAIPAHLLGNMWAQEWESLIDIARPYPNGAVLDVTDEMRRRKFTPMTMFEIAEDFFTSIGLRRMTSEFWQRSMLSKPNDTRREVACHGSATNFFDGHDFRIRMCTDVTMQDLNTAHHEMGHIEYFMQYRHQPVLFQDGANSAFHEAVGDTVQYSFLNPDHLYRVGLLAEPAQHPEDDLNFLMSQALRKLPLIPFSLVMDKWRWELFAGIINKKNANQRWWQLKRKYTGIKPPIPRTQFDFDPGAKYHIPDNTPYIRYFIGSFLQVQFHRALCSKSGQSRVPLHRCSIYGSKQAGSLLKSVLELGSSIPWREAMDMLTGQSEVSADALLEYYGPLYRWLLRENRKSRNE